VTVSRSGILKNGADTYFTTVVRHVNELVCVIVLQVYLLNILKVKQTYFVTVFVLITVAIDLTVLSLKRFRFFISYEAMYVCCCHIVHAVSYLPK